LAIAVAPPLAVAMEAPIPLRRAGPPRRLPRPSCPKNRHSAKRRKPTPRRTTAVVAAPLMSRPIGLGSERQDSTGSAVHNLALSVERAQAVAAFLKDDVDDWLPRYKTGKQKSTAWGTREDQYMQSFVSDGSGKPYLVSAVSGKSDSATRDAVHRFQGVAASTEPGSGTTTNCEAMFAKPRDASDNQVRRSSIAGRSRPRKGGPARLRCGQ
jgi:hypothetical protein